MINPTGRVRPGRDRKAFSMDTLADACTFNLASAPGSRDGRPTA